MERGDRVLGSSPAQRKRAIVEVLVFAGVVLLLIRAVMTAQQVLGLPNIVLALVPVLFIYAPVLLCNLRGVDSYSYRLCIPAFRDGRAWGDALRTNLLLLGAGIVPWMVGYHVYQTTLFGHSPSWRKFLRGVDPVEYPLWLADGPLGEILTRPGVELGIALSSLVATHLFFVAIPEEFFYRGYVQTRLNEVFPRKFIIAGIPFGHGLWIATLIFAFGHSVVEFQWWHFATFFPGLLFALLRERSGGIITGAFLHAACNIIVSIQDRAYGIG